MRRPIGVLAFSSAVAVWLLLASPSLAEAYVGPGSGFALLSSFFVFLATILLSLLSFIAWPLRMLWRLIRRRPRAHPLITRLIIVGLDGQDPALTERYLAAGQLPNLRKLADAGSYQRVRSPFPTASADAWASFSTGADSVNHQDSKPFWFHLGEHGIWSSILLVPGTWPPTRFFGAQLNDLSASDLRDTPGTFTLHTTRPGAAGFKDGGLRIPITVDHDRFETTIRGFGQAFGPPARPIDLPLQVSLDRAARRAHASVDGVRVTLEPGRMTDWITISFRAAPWSRTSGLCRLLLTEMGEHVSLYVTPVNIDPERPARPVSYPSFYAKYLATRIGPFATLGLAEAARALGEGVISGADYLAQVYDIEREREAMCVAALDRLRTGTLVSVFDASDRIQQMFEGNAIDQLYAHNDALVGRIMARLQSGDVFMVLSAGVLFSSRPIDVSDPALIDLAPTALRLFGVEPPARMAGRPLFRFDSSQEAAT